MVKQTEEKEESTGVSDSAIEVKSCPICLALIDNRSLTDSCRHEFCFDCIKQWSEDHNQCPVCRQTYHYIVHNIVSELVFDRLPVEMRIEVVDSDITQLLHRMILYLRVLSVRNRSVRQRDQISDNVNRLTQRLSESDGKTEELTQELQRLESEYERLNSDINQLNGVLSSEDSTDNELTNALNGREENIDEVFDVIDIVLEPFSDELDTDVIDDEDYDNESIDSLPSLVSANDTSDDESADHSDNHSDDESDGNETQKRRTDRKRRRDSDEDDSHSRRSGKRSRNQ